MGIPSENCDVAAVFVRCRHTCVQRDRVDSDADERDNAYGAY